MTRRILKKPRKGTGFSLIETLVALLLVSMVLLLALHLTTLQPRTMDRLRTNEAALRAVETALETIRSGQTPMVEGTFPLTPPGAYIADPVIGGLKMTIEVTRSPTVDDLYLVAVEARYVVAKQARRRRIETLVWRPS